MLRLDTIYHDGEEHIFYSDRSNTIRIKAAEGQTLIIDGVGGSGGAGESINTQVIYNSEEVLTGNSNFTYDGDYLTVSDTGIKTKALFGITSGNFNEIDRGNPPQSVVSTQTSVMRSLGTDVSMSRNANYSAFACPFYIFGGSFGGVSMWNESAPGSVTFDQYISGILTYANFTLEATVKFCSVNEDASLMILTDGGNHSTNQSTQTTWERSGALWTSVSDVPKVSACKISGTRMLSYDYNSNFSVYNYSTGVWSLMNNLMINGLGTNFNLDYPMAIDVNRLAFYYSGNIYLYSFAGTWILSQTIATSCVSLDYYNDVLVNIGSSLNIYEAGVLTYSDTVSGALSVCYNGTYVFVGTSTSIFIYSKVIGIWTKSTNSTSVTGLKKMACNANFLTVGCPTIGAYGTGYIYQIIPFVSGNVIINTLNLVNSSQKIEAIAPEGIILNSASGNINIIGRDSVDVSSNSGNINISGSDGIILSSSNYLSLNPLLGTSTDYPLYLNTLTNRSLSTNYAGLVRSNGWISKGIFVPPGWGTNLKNALLGSDTTLANIAFIGESITQGYDASNFGTTSYVSRVRIGLQNSFEDGGSGYVSVRNSIYDGSYTSTQTNCSKSLNWTAIQNSGGPANFLLSSAVNGSTITFTNVIGTRIRLFYGRDLNGGNFTVSIDGGTAVTVNSNGTAFVAVYTVTGLSFVPHTVVITCQSAPSLTLIYGVRGFHTQGVTCDNFGIAEQTSGSLLLSTGAVQYGNVADWSGGINFQAKLVVYAIGLHDAKGLSGGATTADNYLTNFLTWAKRVREGQIYNQSGGRVDLMFFSPHIGQWQNPASPEYYLMMNRIESILMTYNIAYINMSTIYNNSYKDALSASLWSNGHTGTGAAGSDAVHPGNVGSQIYADAILSVINTTKDY